jgi:hypothetical protein
MIIAMAKTVKYAGYWRRKRRPGLVEAAGGFHDANNSVVRILVVLVSLAPSEPSRQKTS